MSVIYIYAENFIEIDCSISGENLRFEIFNVYITGINLRNALFKFPLHTQMKK